MKRGRFVASIVGCLLGLTTLGVGAQPSSGTVGLLGLHYGSLTGVSGSFAIMHGNEGYSGRGDLATESLAGPFAVTEIGTGGAT